MPWQSKSAAIESICPLLSTNQSQQIVVAAPHSLLMFETTTHADYLKLPIQMQSGIYSCRNGNQTGTRLSSAAGSLWSSVGNEISSNLAIPGAGGTIIRTPNSLMRCAKCCIFAIDGRNLPGCQSASK